MTVYETWQKSSPARPPRSRLYSLTLSGLGTPHLESMTSYLRRLAAAHGVLVSRLIRYEIMPLCRETRTKNMFLDRNSRSLHSTSDLAKEVVWALQRLTGQLDLTFATLLPWVDIVVIEDVLTSTNKIRYWIAVRYNASELPCRIIPYIIKS